MKRRNGFTLIELLAVIVILAIIAVIAVPIVLNIIDESKENATLRSADFYLEAAEMAIANRVMHHGSIADDDYSIMSNGNICLKEYLKQGETETCGGKPLAELKKEDILEVEVKGEKPTSGIITITKGNISDLSIVLNEKTITKNSKNEIVYVKTLDEVCTYIKEDDTTEKTAGAKYKCKVDPNRDPYTFFVLNTRNKAGEIIISTTIDREAVSVNLIMEQNVNSDGTPVTKSILEIKKDDNSGIYNLVPWINKDDYNPLYPRDEKICWDVNGCVLNDKGPLTAMNYLIDATKNWTNANEIVVDTFTDNKGSAYNMKSYNTYARMPYFSEVDNFDNNNGYLYENLDGGYWGYDESTKPSNNIKDIFGYWILSTDADRSDVVLGVNYSGNLIIRPMEHDDVFGVRPVINLKI